MEERIIKLLRDMMWGEVCAKYQAFMETFIHLEEEEIYNKGCRAFEKLRNELEKAKAI